jgi:hypothetical protein
MPAPSVFPDRAGIVIAAEPAYHGSRFRSRTTDFGGDDMWTGGPEDYVNGAARMIASELRRNRSRERARAVKFSREQVERSRELAHEAEAAELQRLAALGQIPASEYKARTTTLEGVGDLRPPA